MNSIAGFLIYFSVFALLLAGIAVGLEYVLAPVVILSPNFWLLFVFIYLLNVIVYLLSILGIRKGGEYGVFSILGGIIIKMIFSLSLFLVILVKSTENQMVLGLNFFSIYLCFMVFEVIYLLRKLRHQNKM